MSLLEVPRVVFDTNVILSTVLFRGSRLAWLRSHWMVKRCIPLISRATALELTRVLSYPKFHLAQEERLRLHGLYVPYCETVEVTGSCPLICRDPRDQMFLDLAQSGNADTLVTGDEDLLVLAPQAKFRIDTPGSYRQRIATGS